MDYRQVLERHANQRQLILRGEVTREKQELLCTALELLEMQSDEPIVLLIDTFGGDVGPAMILFDAIQLCGVGVHADVMKAHSAGFFVLQACDLRIGRPHSTYLFHGGKFSASVDRGKYAWKEYEGRVKEHEEFLWYLAERSGQDIEELRQWSSADMRFLAPQALGLGFIDDIAS